MKMRDCFVLLLITLSALSACDRLRLEGQGGSNSEPEWGVTLKL